MRTLVVAELMMITLSLLCAPALHGKSVRDRGFQHRSRDSVPAKETSGDTAQAPTQVGHTTQASSSGKNLRDIRMRCSVSQTIMFLFETFVIESTLLDGKLSRLRTLGFA